MLREKAQAAPTARPKVPMRRLGAHCLVVVMKRGNARGAKGVGHQRWIGSTGNGRNPVINGRRRPSLGGTSRMMREYHVRICERLGVKFPGPTRQERPSRSALSRDRCTLNCGSSRVSADTEDPTQDQGAATCRPSALLSTAAKRTPARLNCNATSFSARAAYA